MVNRAKNRCQSCLTFLSGYGRPPESEANSARLIADERRYSSKAICANKALLTHSSLYFEELLQFAKDMRAESERYLREGLTEDELELFDLLKKDKMTNEETQKVRLAAKSLLHRLREESPKVLIQDWFKDGQSKLRVRSAVETVLHTHLPESYDRVVFTEKCNKVFDLMLDSASQGLKWAA